MLVYLLYTIVRGGRSHVGIPTFHNCGKKHFGKCLAGTSGCYGQGKNDHKMKDCPPLLDRGKSATQSSPNVPNLDDQKNTQFCSFQSKESKGADLDKNTDK